MIGALAACVLAVLIWPDERAVRRLRRVSLSGREAARARPSSSAGRWPVAPLAGAIAAALAAAVSTGLVAVLAGVAATAAAHAWLGRQRGERDDRRLLALTEALGALGADLRSGRSLESATDAAVAACADEECGRALGRAVRAPNPAGTGEDDVLAGALRRLSAGVRLSARTGCSLASVLAAVEDDLRARRRHRLELRAATAGPRASAMLLAALPLLGLAMGSGVGADPWGVLTTTPTGQVLLVAGVALECAGLAWSRALVRRAVR